jgi:hypothetical protein
MGSHIWSRNFLYEGRAPDEKNEKGKHPVETWVVCSVCGTQVCQMGYGSKAQLVYRETARHEWTSVEPECHVPPTVKVPLPGWVENPDGSWRWSKKAKKKAEEQ